MSSDVFERNLWLCVCGIMCGCMFAVIYDYVWLHLCLCVCGVCSSVCVYVWLYEFVIMWCLYYVWLCVCMCGYVCVYSYIWLCVCSYVRLCMWLYVCGWKITRYKSLYRSLRGATASVLGSPAIPCLAAPACSTAFISLPFFRGSGWAIWFSFWYWGV
jgi:hypothetical protein